MKGDQTLDEVRHIVLSESLLFVCVYGGMVRLEIMGFYFSYFLCLSTNTFYLLCCPEVRSLTWESPFNIWGVDQSVWLVDPVVPRPIFALSSSLGFDVELHCIL